MLKKITTGVQRSRTCRKPATNHLSFIFSECVQHSLATITATAAEILQHFNAQLVHMVVWLIQLPTAELRLRPLDIIS